MALADAFRHSAAGDRVWASHPYLLLQQHPAERFVRQLPDDPFHLQIKERNQNFGGVQVGAFHEVLKGHRFIGAEHLEDFFLCAVQRRCARQGREASNCIAWLADGLNNRVVNYSL
jgi:hypothetical protein